MIHKFQKGTETKVTLSFDQPKEETKEFKGAMKTQYMYGVGDEDCFFATEPLHRLIQHLGLKKGDELTITKVDKTNGGEVVTYPDGKPVEIFMVNGVDTDGGGLDSVDQTPTIRTDSMGSSKTDDTLTTLMAQMTEMGKRLKALEYKVNEIKEEELPF
tara:strand:+ start:31744 stop:32217 length:474 start_codon:yes stop_codon:yes gene_type:complete